MKLIKYYIIIITAIICTAASAAGCVTIDTRAKTLALGTDDCVTVFYTTDKRIQTSDGAEFSLLRELSPAADTLLTLAPAPVGCLYNLWLCF